MVKRRPPAPEVDAEAAASFIAGADSPTQESGVDQTTPSPAPTPIMHRSTAGKVNPALTDTSADRLPASMLLRFKEPRDEAQLIAVLAAHYDRSKQYIAHAALVRGLEAMRDEIGKEL